VLPLKQSKNEFQLKVSAMEVIFPAAETIKPENEDWKVKVKDTGSSQQ
jgi:hypothetical protein